MTEAPSASNKTSVIAFGLSVFAMAVAFAGAFFTNQLRPHFGDGPVTGDPIFGVLYGVPVVVGLFGAWLGLRVLNKPATHAGGGFAFFAVLVGLLGALASGAVLYARVIAGSQL